jgi:hypothetical protein
MTDPTPLTGSTLIVVPGIDTGFAFAPHDRGEVQLFTLQPNRPGPEAMLSLLQSTGHRLQQLRRIVIVDNFGLPGEKADAVTDCKVAMVALAHASGAELTSTPWLHAKGIADHEGIDPVDTMALAAEIERYRRAGDTVGEVIIERRMVRQLNSEVHALAQHTGA